MSRNAMGASVVFALWQPGSDYTTVPRRRDQRTGSRPWSLMEIAPLPIVSRGARMQGHAERLPHGLRIVGEVEMAPWQQILMLVERVCGELLISPESAIRHTHVEAEIVQSICDGSPPPTLSKLRGSCSC